jgi:steroid delta-isomerase-like uncharacterized protein
MLPNLPSFVDDLFAAWNAHDVAGVLSHYTADYEELDVARAEPVRGHAEVRRLMAYYLRAFPDLAIALDDCLVDGKRMALYWTWQGTQRGTFMHIPPTGHTVKVRGTSLIALQEGKIRRALRIWDLAGLLRDLKLLPELAG